MTDAVLVEERGVVLGCGAGNVRGVFRDHRSLLPSRKVFAGSQSRNVPPTRAALDFWKASSDFYSLNNVSHPPHLLFEF